MLDWDWYHDHEGARGIALALTKSRTTELIQLANIAGQVGEPFQYDPVTGKILKNTTPDCRYGAANIYSIQKAQKRAICDDRFTGSCAGTYNAGCGPV